MAEAWLLHISLKQKLCILHCWAWVLSYGLSSAGITNCEFHTGRAEKILPQLLKSKEDGQLIVAVLNPARAGLRKDDGFPATEQIMSTRFSPLCP